VRTLRANSVPSVVSAFNIRQFPGKHLSSTSPLKDESPTSRSGSRIFFLANALTLA